MATRKGTSLSLDKVEETMPRKGIQLVGTGDCHSRTWVKELKARLIEDDDASGTFQLKEDGQIRFILQNEMIFTLKVKDRTKQAHTCFLYPSFQTVEEMTRVLESWDCKALDQVPRPFISCNSSEEVAEKVNRILDLKNGVEIFPAHIMTPSGVFGSDVRINYLEEFYGDAAERIHAIETGLSADPIVLGLIPELDNITFLSNSDAHSAQLHRMGREFTSLEINSNLSYEAIIRAIRHNKAVRTTEFSPSEGRYFLTGHRELRWRPKDEEQRKRRKKKRWHEKGEFCFFSPNYVPEDDVCPICGRNLTIGVLQRAFEISRAQGSNRQLGDQGKPRKFVHMIPLVEALAKSLGIKTVTSKSVENHYNKIIERVGSECELWFLEPSELRTILDGILPPPGIEKILAIREGKFCFEPPGYDGSYGELQIGKTLDILKFNVVQGTKLPKISRLA